MWLIYIVIVVLGIAFMAIVFALLMMIRNNKIQNRYDIKRVRAEITKTGVNRTGLKLNPEYTYNSYNFLQFLSDSGEVITLNTTNKIFNKSLPGFYGDLEYQGPKLLSFTRLIEHEEQRLAMKAEDSSLFHQTEAKESVLFYCDAPSLGISIPSNHPVNISLDEVLEYCKKIYDNDSEHFFGLEDNNDVIQFSGDGSTTTLVVDIPAVELGGSYQALIQSTQKLEQIVTAFFNKGDLNSIIDLELMKF